MPNFRHLMGMLLFWKQATYRLMSVTTLKQKGIATVSSFSNQMRSCHDVTFAEFNVQKRSLFHRENYIFSLEFLIREIQNFVFLDKVSKIISWCQFFRQKTATRATDTGMSKVHGLFLMKMLLLHMTKTFKEGVMAVITTLPSPHM